MPHWPRRWPFRDMAELAVIGHIDGLLVSPHFAQPNAIEFDQGLEWRALRRRVAFSRSRLRQEHIWQVYDAMRAASRVIGLPLKSGQPPPQSTDNQSKTLWLRKLPSTCSYASLVSGFEQWGGQVTILVDPITAAETGQALVKMMSHEQAVRIEGDIKKMVLMMAASPRPLEATLARAGKPQGTQAIYNSAMWLLFHTDDSQRQHKPDFRIIQHPASREEQIAFKLRSLLASQEGERQQLTAQVLENERELARRIENHLDQEFHKLIDLHRFSSNYFAVDPMTQTRDLALPPRYRPGTGMMQTGTF